MYLVWRSVGSCVAVHSERGQLMAIVVDSNYHSVLDEVPKFLCYTYML